MVNATIDYQRLAGDYAAHRRVHPGVLQDIVERAGLTSDSRVLEAGCGTGNYVVAIQAATGCTANGFDPSSAMLAVARERAPELTWIDAAGESIPLPDAAFDLVYSVDVIHHVKDRPAYFGEALRVLAPGGLLCTATDSEEDIARRRPLSSHFPETIPAESARYPAIATLRGEMQAAGFRDIATSNVELEYPLTDVSGYRDKAYSSLHLISAEAHARGVAKLEAELVLGPIPSLSLYTLVWGAK